MKTETKAPPSGPAYKKLVAVLKKQRAGITVADMTAKTALPLAEVRSLISAAADEYNARLQVSESGEIVYSFPHGFSSRYRGFGAGLRVFWDKFGGAIKTFLFWAFKVWIMVMLVGYFVLFVLLVLAAVVFAVAASSAGSRDSRGRSRNSGGAVGGYMVSNLLSTIMRFWFYSNLMKGAGYGNRYGNQRQQPRDGDGRPLYKKIFSFVFGDGDPNPNWEEEEAKKVIAYLRAHSGVISLPEFMILTGQDSQSADRAILRYCSNYGGSPEATDDGTVVYRFDDILLSAEGGVQASLATGAKNPWKFSENKAGSNIAYALINGVNLAFGSYFLYFLSQLPALEAGQSLGGSFLFIFVYNGIAQFGVDPVPTIAFTLGLVPFVFSFLFWLVPAIRSITLKKKNAAIEKENSRKAAYGSIWERPLSVTETPPVTPALLKEMGHYSVPDVEIAGGQTVYSFKELELEKTALGKYRATVGSGSYRRGDIGKTVFDSDV